MNVEERHEIPCRDEEMVKVIWEERATWCHACENGKMWRGVLDG